MIDINKKIEKYLNEEKVKKGDKVEILRKDVHKDLKKIKGPKYGVVTSVDGSYIMVKSKDIPELEMELYPNEIKKV